jgi:hypothetical protein
MFQVVHEMFSTTLSVETDPNMVRLVRPTGFLFFSRTRGAWAVTVTQWVTLAG